MKKEEKEILQALIAIQVRGILEDLHRGYEPHSWTGDFSDVKVITPEREIPWNELKLISDKEMHFLMIKIEKSIQNALDRYYQSKNDPLNNIVIKQMTASYFNYGPSWNRKDHNDYLIRLEEYRKNMNK